MFAVKKNQVIITALVAMIAAAGYLNYIDSAPQKANEVMLTDNSDIALVGDSNNVAVTDDNPEIAAAESTTSGSTSSEKNEDMVYSYALDLMKMGYTVYIPDLLGSGERRLGVYDDVQKSDCDELNFALISLGMSLQGVIVYELMCLVDYIEKEDSVKKLGVVGFSGGGFSGLWLGILDERVKYIVSSCYFHSFKDTLLFTNKCGCNFIPKLWNRVDMGDMAALLAPRPLYIEVGKEDSLNGDRGIIGVREQIERAKNVYKLFDKDIEYKECEGQHQWFGSCYDWINKL